MLLLTTVWLKNNRANLPITTQLASSLVTASLKSSSTLGWTRRYGRRLCSFITCFQSGWRGQYQTMELKDSFACFALWQIFWGVLDPVTPFTCIIAMAGVRISSIGMSKPNLNNFACNPALVLALSLVTNFTLIPA